MTIQICSIKRLYQILADGNTDKCGAIICSTSKIDTAKLYGISYVIRQYEDLDTSVQADPFPRPMRTVITIEYEADFAFIILHHQKH